MSTIIQLTVCFFNPQATDVDYYTVNSMFFLTPRTLMWTIIQLTVCFFKPQNTDVDYYTVDSMFF